MLAGLWDGLLANAFEASLAAGLPGALDFGRAFAAGFAAGLAPLAAGLAAGFGFAALAAALALAVALPGVGLPAADLRAGAFLAGLLLTIDITPGGGGYTRF